MAIRIEQPLPSEHLPGGESLQKTKTAFGTGGLVPPAIAPISPSETYAAPSHAIGIGDAAAEGVLTSELRSDAVYAFPAPVAGYPQPVAATKSDGVATTPMRSDAVLPLGIGNTKGDLIVWNNTPVASRIGVGSDNQVLLADSAQAQGVKWGAAPATSKIVDVEDTFTTNAGALLSAHSADTGETWISEGATTAQITAATNRVRPTTRDLAAQYRSSVRFCYDWEVTADIFCATETGDEVAFGVRYDPANPTIGMYAGTLYGAAREWRIRNLAGGILTTRGVPDFAPNTTRRIRFAVSGQTCSLWIDALAGAGYVLTLWGESTTPTPGGVFLYMLHGSNAASDAVGLQITNLKFYGDAAIMAAYPFQSRGDLLVSRAVSGGLGGFTNNLIPDRLAIGSTGQLLQADTSLERGMAWVDVTPLVDFTNAQNIFANRVFGG